MKRVLRFLGLAALCGLGLNALADVAKVGETGYATFDEALAAWGPGKTLTLLQNVERSSTFTVEVNANKSTSNWDLKLGDYTWTANGCDAIRLYSAGGVDINVNYGLRIYANQNGGISAPGYNCIKAENDSNTVSGNRYRARLEFNGGHYVGEYVLYYSLQQWNSEPFGPAPHFKKGDDGSIPVFDGAMAIYKTRVEINAGVFNGSSFYTYPVTSTADTWYNAYGLKFKVLPSNKNTKQGKYFSSDFAFLYDAEQYFVSVQPSVMQAGSDYQATLPASKALFDNANLVGYGYPNANIFYAEANTAIAKAASGTTVTLYADATQPKALTKGQTLTVVRENGAAYDGDTLVTSGSTGYKIVKTVIDEKTDKYATEFDPDLCEAKIGDKFYATADEAIKAAVSGNTIVFIQGVGTAAKTLADKATLTLVFEKGAYDYANLVVGDTACDIRAEVSDEGKTVVLTSVLNPAKCQTKVGDQYYATLKSALSSAPAGSTIVINDSVDLGSSSASGSKSETIDLNGKGIVIAYASGRAVNCNGGTWTFMDSGKGGSVKNTYASPSSSSFGVIGVSGATVNVSGGTYESAGRIFYVSSSASSVLNISGGTFIGTLADDARADKVHVTGGLFSKDPTKFVDEGYVAVLGEDGLYKVIANKVEVKEIGLTEENVTIVDEKGEPVPEEKQEAAQQAVVEANEQLKEVINSIPPVDTGIEKASKESVVTPSGEVIAGPAKSSVVNALQASLREDAKTEDIPAEAVNQISVLSDISERLEIKIDSEVTQVKDVTISGQPAQMEATLDVIVWDVKPIVKTVVTIGEGDEAVEKVVEAQLPDEEVKKNPVTFRLAVSDPAATGAYVRHVGHDEFEDETIFCKVQGPAGGRYIELTVDHFSLFEVRTTGEVVEELDDAIGIINLGVPGAGKELAAAVPFTTAGTTAKLDDLVMTGVASGDKILVQKAEGEGYDEYTFNGTTWGDVSLAPGTTFWYQSANGSEAPLTLAGIVTESVSTAVVAGDAAAPKATLLVNPFNSAADLVAAVGSAAAEGDQIALAGDNGGKDVRYVFKGEQWGYYTKPAAVTSAGIYLADDVFKPVTAISLPGGKGAWYISKGGAPTVAWSTAGVTGSSEQIASSDAQIYGVLDWFVALDAADMDSFGHEGIRLVGYGADGEVFRYGRDFAGDTFAASNTVFLGLGGGTGAAASFAVELLDADDNVIAVSERVTDLGSALTATYAGSKAPATATTPVQFANFGAGDDGEFAFLRAAFAGKGVVKSLADGCEVVLTNDIAGCVTLADNLGAVTLDLNSHSISGTVATAEAPGGNAILISEEAHLPEATNPTALTILNRGSFAQVAGGDGFSGLVPQAGGSAIKVESDLDGITVTVDAANRQDAGKLVQGGKGGSGVDGADLAVAGFAVEGNATLVDADGFAANGANGVEINSWAWCFASDVAEIPYGVSFDAVSGKYFFWERDDAGKATFDFAKVSAWDVTDDAIHFVGGAIDVDQFTVPASAGSLTFVGEDDTILAAAADACAFEVTTGADDVRAWTNLMFTGSGIAVMGGRIEVAKCEFSGCSSEQFGGAIAAHALSGESTVVDSTFTGCFADDGGAIFATGATASGVTLKVVRSTFTENTAANGGAISTQTRNADAYTLALDIANSTFLRNQTLPGCSGGAIAAQGNVSIDADATVDAPGTTLFEGNRAYVSGGAIDITFSAVREGSSEANDAALLIGRGVRFVGNSVTGGSEALGGAISIDETPVGCKYALEAEGVLFKENIVTGETGAYEALGGAIFVYGGTDADDTEVTVDTCVFDGNGAFAGDANVAIYGGALEIEYSKATVKNSTFRNSNIEAVSFLGGNVAVENCVAVGNNTAGYDDASDLLFDSVGSAKMTYTAYDKVDLYETTLSDDSGNNLADCTTAIYDGDSLKLNPAGFNPVAVFGLTQDGARDFEGTWYGLEGCWSMGAFEAVTVKLTVTVTGDREYNGNTSSNGIAAFGFALSTNGVSVADNFCAELGDVTTAFEVTAWEYGGKDVGFYASTNAAETAKVTATVALVAEDKEVLLNALDFIYEGTISPTVNGLAMTIEPLDYAWTGSEIVPTSVTVIDTLSGETLVKDVDYRITYGDNVNPTDSAKVVVTGSRNYYGGTAVSNFWITAYTVNHVFDGEVLGTELFGATGGQEVVGHELNEIPAGYCFDWQNSETNGVALKIGEGGLTAIDVLYWTDENGDQVPDKFQKKITAKVVNGEWNDDALSGLNQTVWVTLATEDGKWDAVSGIGAFGTDHASHALPSAGLAPDGKSQAQGGWIAFAGGSGYVVPDPSALTITADMTPILLYGYIAKTSTSGGRTGHGAKGGTTTSSESTLADLAKQYKVAAALTAFSLDSAAGMATMAPKKSLMRSGTEVEPIDLKGSTVTIRVMRTLGGPAEEYPAQVGSDGNVTVPAEGAQGFYQLAE